MAGGPCAKIFMTVECSLLSRQLMAPDDVWIFYFRLFVYLFIFFVAPREESRRRYIVSLNRDAQFAVSIDRSERILFPFSIPFLSNHPWIRGRSAARFRFTRKRDRACPSNVVKVNRSYAHITPERLYTGGRRVALELCTLQIVSE